MFPDVSYRDAIVAVSSPPGQSWRGLIRFTGTDVHHICQQLLTPLPPTPRRLQAARWRQPDIPILTCRFAQPNSFTGEELVEVQMPGHPALLERALRQAIDLGVRLAEPGEFTYRAFAHGKLDLTQAEGIAATIAAESDSQLRAAATLREGELGRYAHTYVDQLGTLLALVEAGIDFTDQEDVVPIEPGQLHQRLHAVAQQLHALLSRSRSWGSLEALPRVVLVGPPSSGKSTLFNALLNRPRAVIHDMPGTTRDVLSEPLTLPDDAGGSIELLLQDMAGLDDAASLLDEHAQVAAKRALAQADLIVLVHDPTRTPPAPWPHHDLPQQTQTPRLHVMTKMDMVNEADSTQTFAPQNAVAVSAMRGWGLDALRRQLVQHLGERGTSMTGDMLALQPRHEQALRDAHVHLQQAVAMVEPQAEAHQLDHVELIAGAMRESLDALAALGGQLTPDDVIGKVFASFCVGK